MCKVSTEALGSVPAATLYRWGGGEGGEQGQKGGGGGEQRDGMGGESKRVE